MKPSLILHGGAGAMRTMTEGREAAYRQGLLEAAEVGRSILSAGEAALDAAVAVVRCMEDSGIFNAGAGACLTEDGTVEMDAAVMCGTDRGFGGVAAVSGVANPVELARAILDSTPHCLLVGLGAARFARRQDLPFREELPSPARVRQWEAKRRQLAGASAVDPAERLASLGGVLGEDEEGRLPVGEGDTVGVCVRDQAGCFAAAVSTGGIWMKMAGRVGDSPLPGAGLWALDGAGAAVATGTGELILRMLLSKDAVDGMEQGAQAACEAAVARLGQELAVGQVGIVGLDSSGEPGFALDSRGMGRAYWRGGMGSPQIAVWPDELWSSAGDA